MQANFQETLENYEILSQLGTGASSEVMLARDMNSGGRVAIKILNRKLGNEGEELFMNEIKALNVLDHPNIIKVFGMGQGEYKK